MGSTAVFVVALVFVLSHVAAEVSGTGVGNVVKQENGVCADGTTTCDGLQMQLGAEEFHSLLQGTKKLGASALIKHHASHLSNLSRDNCGTIQGLQLGCPRYDLNRIKCDDCVNIYKAEFDTCAWQAESCVDQLKGNNEWLAQNIDSTRGNLKFVKYRMEELNCFDSSDGKGYEEIRGNSHLPWVGHKVVEIKQLLTGHNTAEKANKVCDETDDCVYFGHDESKGYAAAFSIDPSSGDAELFAPTTQDESYDNHGAQPATTLTFKMYHGKIRESSFGLGMCADGDTLIQIGGAEYKAVKSFNECRQLCKGEQQCSLFGYNWANNLCRLNKWRPNGGGEGCRLSQKKQTTQQRWNTYLMKRICTSAEKGEYDRKKAEFNQKTSDLNKFTSYFANNQKALVVAKCKQEEFKCASDYLIAAVSKLWGMLNICHIITVVGMALGAAVDFVATMIPYVGVLVKAMQSQPMCVGFLGTLAGGTLGKVTLTGTIAKGIEYVLCYLLKLIWGKKDVKKAYLFGVPVLDITDESCKLIPLTGRMASFLGGILCGQPGTILFGGFVTPKILCNTHKSDDEMCQTDACTMIPNVQAELKEGEVQLLGALGNLFR